MDTPVINEPKATTTDNVIKVIGATFGALHFVLQSAADLTANAEGSLVHKVSKGAISKAEVITNRKNVTTLRQQSILSKIDEIKAKHAKPQTV